MTRLYSGEWVSKSTSRIAAVGAVDETVSMLGLARALSQNEDVRARIERIQRALFLAGAELATTPPQLARMPQRLDQAAADTLDRECSDLEKAAPHPEGFILPGASAAGAALDVARSVARRLERHAAHMTQAGEINTPDLLRWLNRLSDYLWLLARREEGCSYLLKPRGDA